MNKKGQILIITIYKDIWILKMVKYNSDQFWEKIVFSVLFYTLKKSYFPPDLTLTLYDMK